MSKPLDIQQLASEFAQWQTWAVLAAVALAGLLGGYASKWTATETQQNKMDPLVGSIAALAMLFVVSAQQLVVLLGISIVAGFAGKTLLNALRARVEALAAQKEAQVAKAAAEEADTLRKEAADKGLIAIRKLRDLAQTSDIVMNEVATPFEPDKLSILAQKTAFLIAPQRHGSPTVSISASLLDGVNELEADLMRLSAVGPDRS